MEAELTLYNNSAFYEPKKIIYVQNEDLTIKVKNVFENIDYFLKVGDNVFEIKNGKVTIKDISSGVLNSLVFATKNGETIKTYSCENLIICELSGENILVPEMEQFKSDYEKKLNEVISKQSEIIKKLTDLEQRICDLENNFDPTVI